MSSINSNTLIEKVNDVISKVRNIDNELSDEICEDIIEIHKTHNKLYLSKINNMTKNIDELRNELNESDKRCDEISQSIKDMAIVREQMNVVFGNLWRMYGIKSANYENMAQQTHQLQKKELIKNNGVKYAVGVLRGITKEVSKEFCEFYLHLNKRCHPEINPKSVVINSLSHLTKLIKDNSLPKCYISTGISLAMLKELESNI